MRDRIFVWTLDSTVLSGGYEIFALDCHALRNSVPFVTHQQHLLPHTASSADTHTEPKEPISDDCSLPLGRYHSLCLLEVIVL
jgi:hypothetical protein